MARIVSVLQDSSLSPKTDTRMRWLTRLTLLALCSVILFAATGCPSRSQPLTCTDDTQKISAVFPNKQITLPDGTPYTLFANGQEFGCVGITWSGQTTNIPNFVARYTETANGVSVAIQDGSGNFVDTPFNATVAAGVDTYDVFFYISRGAPQSINCESYIQGGLSRCFGDDECLLVTRLEGVTTGGENGTCKLCSREVCNNRDDDCNGRVDDNGACGRVIGSCSSVQTVDASTPGCPFTPPEGTTPDQPNYFDGVCAVDQAGEVYVCSGTVAEPKVLQWRKLSDVAAGCDAAATMANPPLTISVGLDSTDFLCDQCGDPVFRNTAASRCQAVLRYVP